MGKEFDRKEAERALQWAIRAARNEIRISESERMEAQAALMSLLNLLDAADDRAGGLVLTEKERADVLATADFIDFDGAQMETQDVIRRAVLLRRVAAAPDVTSEPDAWQMRRYYKGDDAGWGTWKECSAEEAQKWKGRADIQVRPLYAVPSAS